MPRPGELTLSLLMFRILADDSAHDLALAIASQHETAVFADWFAGGTNFHGTVEVED